MLLKDIFRAPKIVTDVGKWKSNELMPKSAFPLHGKGKIVRRVFNWKIIKFNCLGKDFRLLIFYRIDKETYYSWLAIDTTPVTLVAKYEYHATHPGWHLHACIDARNAIPGRTNGHFVRLPSGNAHHRRLDFGISTDDEAHNKAINAFRLDSNPVEDDLFS